MTSVGTGYVTDIPYTRGFYRELAPAWLDFAASISGIAPPSHGGDFAWCELGCGQGATTALLAASHPHGRFVGIDLMPEHIANARRLAEDAGIANVTFHAADFAEPPPDLPHFDYIVAHGVYSWVAPAMQQALLRFIDRRLKPGGLVYLGYNAMPGWAMTVPFQHLLLALGRDAPGDSTMRFSAALATVREIAEAGAHSLGGAALVPRLDTLVTDHPLPYLAHEYMTEHWRPLFVTELRAALATIGLSPAGSAVLADNFDAYVLRRAERELLDGIDGGGGDDDRRELVRDFLRNTRFRRDVFSRDGAPLGNDGRRARLLDATRYALAQPAESVGYSHNTGAGTLSFDNPTAHAIVDALVAGPATGSVLADAVGVSPQDAVANLMALCGGNAVRPVSCVDAPVAMVTALNKAILRRIDGDAITYLALACGTAVRVAPTNLRALRDGNGDETMRALRDYLQVHGAIA